MSDRAVIESIQAITKTRLTDKVWMAECTVDSVDEGSRTCQCTLLEGTVSTSRTVSLMPVVDDGMLLLPTAGSTVKIIYSEYTAPFVAQYSQVDKILFVIDDKAVQITTDGIQLNDGSNGGVPLVNPLVDKINALENAYNNVLQILQSIIIPLAPSGTYPFAPLFGSVQAIQPLTQTGDLENMEVVQ